MAEVPTYWWFERPSAVRLAWRILGAVLTRRFVRLEAIPYTNARGPALRFRVVTTGTVDASAALVSAVQAADVNESWPCPPFCGGGGG